MKKRLKIVVLIISVVLFSFSIRAEFELSMSHMLFSDAAKSQWPRYGIVGILTYIIILLALNAVTNKIQLSMVIMSILAFFVSIANRYTLLYHGTPLTVQEVSNFKTMLNVVGTYSFLIDQYIVSIVVCMVVQLLIALLVWRIKYSSQDRKLSFHLGIMAVFLGYVIYSGKFGIITKQDGGYFLWKDYYDKNGFIVGTIESCAAYLRNAILVPKDYELANSEKENLTKIDNHVSSSLPDIILVLDETWYDLDICIDTNCSINYMSALNEMESAKKGYAYTPGVGGGTNASEYELLTSCSMSLINMSNPFQNSELLKKMSLPKYLKQYGYNTMAFHPGQPNSYDRRTAWPQIGFDQVFFMDSVLDYDWFGSRRYYMTDQSALKYFLHYYNEMPDDKPRFSFLLTIQNHGGWNSNDKTENIVESDFYGKESISDSADEFLSCMEMTNLFIYDMIDYFESQDRPVVICMVGDHAPNFITQMYKYSEKDESEYNRKTPYFIWSNYMELGGENDVDMCQLGPLTLSTARIPLCNYYKYLLQFQDIDLMYDENADDDIKKYFYMEYSVLSMDY